MCQASICGRVKARARVQVLENSASRMVVLRLTTLLARDRHWRKPRRRKLKRAQQHKKRASVHWGAASQCHAQHSLGIEPMSPDSLLLALTTNPLVRFDCWKKTVHDSSYFATRNWFFCVQDCRTWIFQVEFQGQTRNTRILERKPSINTSYRIRHRLGLKYLHLASGRLGYVI